MTHFFTTLICTTLVVCLLTVTGFAQSTISTPEQFLGYAPGQKFTPHHRIVAYAEQVARQAPNRVKLIPYGKTYEGRPLMAIAVASDANFLRLDEIRQNNLKRIGLLAGTPTATTPAIAWLSYNVHGNEAVSSEAFMGVLYGLVSGTNLSAQRVLANTVVILDPCLNPDGHDRYVNWYNQMVGRTADPTPFAREHSEPWPGGRYTHYYFDPNRDWAWQTQEVTQQRMVLYQQWMPHLHADFHEMGVESPYYFAPSAKPYHEEITKFQRDFQKTIGQYSARAFDKQGWLYYTRERYDLFYPSYGDTWPTYNGAIGMTFEQGGGGRAGLGIQKADGDTLTLRQRIDHHTASSTATLESVADRATEIVAEFGTYFDNARQKPVGPYKTYLIKASGDEGRLAALRQLFDRNQIRYGVAGKASTLPGYNYLSQQTDKAVAIAAEDLLISAYQPKSTLLKILFEPKSTLEDSATYDITAWTLPYAYSLQTYGITARLEPVAGRMGRGVEGINNPTSLVPNPTPPYAYLARWQSLPGVQLLAGLLKQKIKVRAAEKPFELEGQRYQAGTLLITRAGNERLDARFDALVQAEAQKWGVYLTPVKTGFVTEGSDFGSGSVSAINPPRVALVMGDGVSATAAGEVWHYFDRELEYPLTLIDGNTLGTADWSKLDVLVMANGYNYGRVLTDKNLTSLKEWIRSGGKLIAMQQAAQFLAGKDGFELKEKEAAGADGSKGKDSTKKLLPTDSLKRYGDRERTAISDDTPGSIYRVTLDSTHPLAFGLTNYYALVQETHNFDLLKDGWNVGYLKGDNYVAGFAGKNAKDKLKQTLSLGVQSMGRGTVVYLADDPLFRGFWYSGKLLFGNAVFMTGN